MSQEHHKSVLIDEICELANLKDSGLYVDATFGAGGYSRRILEEKNCQLFSFDRDENVKNFVNEVQNEFPGNFTFYHEKFSNMAETIPAEFIGKIDAVIFDLGVSSMQIDSAERGFSFMHDGPIDMRMGKGSRDVKQFINSAEEEEIANVIYELGEERYSRRIAKKIVEFRQNCKFSRTLELAEVVASAVRKSGKIHPATKTFQAFRIWANDELGEIEKALDAALKVLKKDGRILVVSFHGLEDLIVKRFFNDHSGKKEAISRYMPDISDVTPEGDEYKKLKIITKKVIKPLESEIKNNVRARSSRLRVAQKLR